MNSDDGIRWIPIRPNGPTLGFRPAVLCLIRCDGLDPMVLVRSDLPRMMAWKGKVKSRRIPATAGIPAAVTTVLGGGCRLRLIGTGRRTRRLLNHPNRVSNVRVIVKTNSGCKCHVIPYAWGPRRVRKGMKFEERVAIV